MPLNNSPSLLQKKARVAFSDQEGRNELFGGEDSQYSSEDQVIFYPRMIFNHFTSKDSLSHKDIVLSFSWMFITGFVQVMENLESHGI